MSSLLPVVLGRCMGRCPGIVCYRRPDTDELPSIFDAAPGQLFRSTPHRVLTALGSDLQPERTLEAHFNQFARIDEGLWAWHFVLRDVQGEGIASVNRAFRGFGREVRWRLTPWTNVNEYFTPRSSRIQGNTPCPSGHRMNKNKFTV